MPKFSLMVDPETAKAANAAVSRRLAVPANAVVKGTTKKWNEILEIVAASGAMSDKEEKKGCLTIEVRFTVPPDVDPENINNGRTWTLWFDVYPESFHNPSHPKFKATNMNIGKLNGLLRALGFEIERGEIADYGEYFSADEGENPPVVGQRVDALIREYEYKDEQYQTADEFNPVEGS